MAKKVLPLINHDLYKETVEIFTHLNEYGIEPYNKPINNKYGIQHHKPILAEPIIDEGEWKDVPASSI
jgi:hypothetical protein